MSTFDVVAHERRRRSLIAAAGRDCDPLIRRSMLEQFDRVFGKPEPSNHDHLLQLLRDTEPGLVRRAA